MFPFISRVMTSVCFIYSRNHKRLLWCSFTQWILSFTEGLHCLNAWQYIVTKVTASFYDIFSFPFLRVTVRENFNGLISWHIFSMCFLKTSCSLLNAFASKKFCILLLKLFYFLTWDTCVLFIVLTLFLQCHAFTQINICTQTNTVFQSRVPLMHWKNSLPGRG